MEVSNLLEILEQRSHESAAETTQRVEQTVLFKQIVDAMEWAFAGTGLVANAIAFAVNDFWGIGGRSPTNFVYASLANLDSRIFALTGKTVDIAGLYHKALFSVLGGSLGGAELNRRAHAVYHATRVAAIFAYIGAGVSHGIYKTMDWGKHKPITPKDVENKIKEIFVDAQKRIKTKLTAEDKKKYAEDLMESVKQLQDVVGEDIIDNENAIYNVDVDVDDEVLGDSFVIFNM